MHPQGVTHGDLGEHKAQGSLHRALHPKPQPSSCNPNSKPTKPPVRGSRPCASTSSGLCKTQLALQAPAEARAERGSSLTFSKLLRDILEFLGASRLHRHDHLFALKY